jgi:hypothetical protein
MEASDRRHGTPNAGGARHERWTRARGLRGPLRMGGSAGTTDLRGIGLLNSKEGS